MLCKALRKNKAWQEANVALMEYLEFKFQEAESAKDTNTKAEIEKEAEQAIVLCQEIIDEFNADFDEENQSDLTDERCQANLLELQPILNCKIKHDKFLLIKQSAYFFKGKCHEKLGGNSAAWSAYCSVKDKKSPFYKEAIRARKQLLKKQIEIFVNIASLQNMSSLSINHGNENKLSMKEKKSSNLMLPQGIPLPAKFDASLVEETEVPRMTNPTRHFHQI